jgi:hypothetical protein
MINYTESAYGQTPAAGPQFPGAINQHSTAE